MRRFLWLWIVLAFLVGLAPGAALFLLTRGSYIATNRQVISRNAQLSAKNRQLQQRLDSAEASASALSAQVARLQPAAAVTGTATSAAGASSGPPNITSREVTPATTAGGGKITLTVKLTGRADKANMRIVGPGGTFDKTYFLGRTGLENGAEVWEKTIEAPSGAGQYRYYAIAFRDGKKYTMPQTDGFTFTVR